MHCFSFLCWIKVCSGHFRQILLSFWDKKLIAGPSKQVVVLYRKDCKEIDLSRLDIDRLGGVVILHRWLFEQG